MKLILSIITCFLFERSFWICKYYYPFDNCPTENTDLRYSFFAAIIFLSAINAIKEFTKYDSESYKKLVKFFCETTLGFCFSDVIDRYIFDITTFTKEDYILRISAPTIAYLHVYNGEKIYKWFKNKYNNIIKKIKTWLKFKHQKNSH